MYGTFVNPAFFAGNLPYPADDAVVKAFVHGWSPFAFEIVGLGTFMLWASRNPRRYLGAVWLLVWLELLHGVLDDIYLIANGYERGRLHWLHRRPPGHHRHRCAVCPPGRGRGGGSALESGAIQRIALQPAAGLCVPTVIEDKPWSQPNN